MAGMSLQRFAQILDAYGARPERWPENEREEARALLQRSPGARAEHEAARRLDAALDTAPLLTPSSELEARVLAAAPIAAATRGGNRRTTRSRETSSQRVPRTPGTRAWRRVAAAAVLTAAAAVAVWIQAPVTIWTPGAPPPQAGELTIAELGSYEMPTDALLGAPDVDLASSLPALGCEESGLGCWDSEMQQDTKRNFSRRVRA